MFRDGAEPQIDPEDRAFVAEAMALLPEGPHDNDTWGKWTAAVKEATGRKGKGLFMPLRKALTGQAHGPDMAKVSAAVAGDPGEGLSALNLRDGRQRDAAPSPV